MGNIYCFGNILTGLTFYSFEVNITILQIFLRRDAILDFIKALFTDVIYIQNVTLFHGKRANMISFTPIWKF
jgi:hypothetical protein